LIAAESLQKVQGPQAFTDRRIAALSHDPQLAELFLINTETKNRGDLLAAQLLN
jgi:hypothetical protein